MINIYIQQRDKTYRESRNTVTDSLNLWINWIAMVLFEWKNVYRNILLYCLGVFETSHETTADRSPEICQDPLLWYDNNFFFSYQRR